MHSAFPPILPDQDAARTDAPRTWPTWFGVIAIVFGALLALGGCCGSLMPQLMGVMGRMAQMDFPEPPAFLRWAILGDSVVSIGLAVPLVLGGIQLLRRRARGRSLLMGYAAARLALALPLLAVGYLSAGPNAQWTADIARSQIAAMEKANAGAKVPANLKAQAANTEPTTWNYAMVFLMAPLGLVFPAAIVLKLGSGAVKDEVSRWER